jgi:hypothetical protein
VFDAISAAKDIVFSFNSPSTPTVAKAEMPSLFRHPAICPLDSRSNKYHSSLTFRFEQSATSQQMNTMRTTGTKSMQFSVKLREGSFESWLLTVSSSVHLILNHVRASFI